LFTARARFIRPRGFPTCRSRSRGCRSSRAQTRQLRRSCARTENSHHPTLASVVSLAIFDANRTHRFRSFPRVSVRVRVARTRARIRVVVVVVVNVPPIFCERLNSSPVASVVLNDTRLGGLPAVVGRASTEDFRPLITDDFLALGTKDSIVVAASSFASTVRNGVAMITKSIEFQRTASVVSIGSRSRSRSRRTLLRLTRRPPRRRSPFGARDASACDASARGFRGRGERNT
jgi:hypothetical protein